MFATLYISLLASLGTRALAAGQSQQVFSTSRASNPAGNAKKYVGADWQVGRYDAGIFSPVETLSTLSASEYTVLSHPVFPRHAARIKKVENFCDPTVQAYSGYIDIEAKHIFFYFFESRNDPDTDDVIFWTNGGPGCSSSMGLFMELGPCRVITENATVFHPESWNSNANVFFVDQPVGVGFSYAEYGEHVDTSEDAAKDIAAFVAIFFENFSSFKGRAFHMAGESYGGRYVPVFAAQVHDQNALLVATGLTPINLVSVIIGNGMTDPYKQVASYYDMSCTPASVPPVLDINTCIRMKKALPRCEKWLKESCIDQFDSMNCEAASNFCETELASPFESTGLNYYDISRPCDGTLEETLCYPITQSIAKYLDQPKIRSLLGVDPTVSQNFSSCSNEVGMAFVVAGDMMQASYEYVAGLLERDVRVLIYVGAYDWICNWISNERWTLALDWSGKTQFASQELREWKVDGAVAGKTRSAKGLTFATVDGAGHMVPYDKPKESLALINRWLAQEDL